jgi:hypothetical protein
MCCYISNLCLRNETHIVDLLTDERLFHIRIPKKERCIAEVALYSSV